MRELNGEIREQRVGNKINATIKKGQRATTVV